MIFELQEKTLIPSKNDTTYSTGKSIPRFAILKEEEFLNSAPDFGLEDRMITDCLKKTANKFESHDGWDYLSFQIPDLGAPLDAPHHLSILYRCDLLVFVSADPFTVPAFQAFFDRLKSQEYNLHHHALEGILAMFLDELTYHDYQKIGEIEEEAATLEEKLMTIGSNDYSMEVIQLRKKLMVCMRYYDQLVVMFSSIEENENSLFSERELRTLRILTGRAERLLAEINNLQDYLSQIREAYQTQIGIHQNKIMKLFTVITAVFLPLTLLVGWYGMNFSMPEYQSPYGYPILALASVLIATSLLLYFKKHKWF